MEKIKLSIVIPYYETFELTVKLLKELGIQKNEEIEIIIVDDCNDKRLDMFNDIATIVHSGKKSGVSHARNVGIEMAKGEYIALVDSDDMVTSDYVDILLDTIQHNPAEIIYFNWADFNKNTIVVKPTNYAVWKAIYKKDIMPLFNEQMEFNEDVDFQAKIKKEEHTEYFINRVLYIYNSDRVGSQMWRKWNK